MKRILVWRFDWTMTFFRTMLVVFLFAHCFLFISASGAEHWEGSKLQDFIPLYVTNVTTPPATTSPATTIAKGNALYSNNLDFGFEIRPLSEGRRGGRKRQKSQKRKGHHRNKGQRGQGFTNSYGQPMSNEDFSDHEHSFDIPPREAVVPSIVPANNPTAKRPTFNRPNRPTANKPTANKPTANKPTALKPTSEVEKTSSSDRHKTDFGGGNSGGSLAPTIADNGNRKSDSAESSPSSPTDLTWLYSLIAAVVALLVVSGFIVSRLHEKRILTNSGHQLPVKQPPEAILNEVVIEMDDQLEKGKGSGFSHLDVTDSKGSKKSSKGFMPTGSLGDLNWLTKKSESGLHNEFGSYHSEAETQTEDVDTTNHHSKTVFRTPWQFSGSFSAEGGVLQRENSDVMLVVGRDAVHSGDYVDIQAAIFTGAAEIRQKFDLPEDEMLITPLVEYHAEGSYQFRQHVSVKLPHALPEDFNMEHIKFYTFTVDDCGHVLLELLPLKPKDNRVEAYWEVSSQERCFIARTTHFSGYFCTSCESKAKLPSIYARVFGSHIQIKSSRREVRLILYIWDRRLNIKDFIEAVKQQECDMDRQLLADESVPLLDNATSDSSIVMRMETLGDPADQQCWQHVSRSNNSRPVFKPLQVRKLRQVVMCCQNSDPLRVEWALENVPDTVPSSVFQGLIEMVHVAEGESVRDDAFLQAEEENVRTFYIRNLKLAKDTVIEEEPVSRHVKVKKAMTHVMSRQEAESICQAFGINKKDVGNLTRKFSSEEEVKTELLEACARHCGVNKFLQSLPFVLQKIHLYHVITALQDKDLLSTQNSVNSQHSHISTEHQATTCNGLGDSTVCKSFDTRPTHQSLQQSSSDNNDTNSHLYDHQNNSLRLNICSYSPDNNQSNVSPDSDYYGSPSNAVGNEHMNCINNGLSWSPQSNGCVSFPSRDSACLYPATYNNLTSNQPNESLEAHVVSKDLVSNCYGSDSVWDAYDSCLVNIDSCEMIRLDRELNGEEIIAKDKVLSGSDLRSEETTAKELAMFDETAAQELAVFGGKGAVEETRREEIAVLGGKGATEETRRKELAVFGDNETELTCTAYPEIPEEQSVSQGLAVTLPTKGRGLLSEIQTSHPSDNPSNCDETFRKVMFV